MIVVQCEACDTSFESPRKDRRWCQIECKRELKRRYDKAHYPSIAKETSARACAWQRKNKARKQQYDADYRARNADKIHARSRSYAKSPESNRMSAARRRARKAQNGDYRVTTRDLRRLWRRCGETCSYCKAPLLWRDIEWDHIVPISRGGVHSIGNLTASCHACNRSKAWKFITEWRAGRVVSQFGLHPSELGLAA